MNVGYLCKLVPAYLPHELLGFKAMSLEGTLLSMKIMNKIVEEENKQINEPKGQSARFAKFKSRK